MESETVTAAYTVVTNPTCLTAGLGRYQASFEADWAEDASKDVTIPALDHDWGEWTSNGDGTHTRVCKRDETHTETVNCSGGTATCTEKATCTDCGGKYGEKDPDNHTGKEEWTITKTKHEQKWSCCGKVTVPEKSHTFGKWVVTKKATSKQAGEKTRTCEVCEYVEKATIQATGAPAKTGDDRYISAAERYIDFTERNLRRAGCDYWNDVEIVRWACAEEFFEAHAADELHLFTGHVSTTFGEVAYSDECYLVFGRESRGLDERWMERFASACVRIPMRDGMRSLNLSNAVAIAAFEALRQNGYPYLQ